MSRYIDAEKLEKEGWSASRTYQQDAKTMVYETKKMTDFPIADVEEVKHAHWVNGICTNCGIEKPVVTVYRGFDDIVYQYQGELNYCPNCGTDMRERRDDGTVH